MLNYFLFFIGVFYLCAASVVAKAHLNGAVIDAVIRALDMRAMQPVERWRLIWLLLGTLWVGLAGLFALMQLRGVWALFVFSFIWQGLYLLVLAPRYFDTLDEPDPSGRAQTWRAFLAYGVVTAMVIWGSNQSNTLQALSQASAWKQALVVLLPALGLAYLASKAWRAIHWPQDGALTREQSIPSRDNHAAEARLESEAQDNTVERDDSIQVLIRPSWNEGGLFNAQTGEAIDYPEQRLGISEQQHDLVGDWLWLWREHADPADPERQALLTAESLPLIAAAGQDLAETFKSILGPERVSFSPLAQPCLPKWTVTGLRLISNYQCNALWFDADDEGVGDIPTEQLGLSWSLSRDLDAWALSYDESIDMADPGGARNKSTLQEQEHERQGQALMQRLRTELDATGRAAVRLSLG
jgi:hypothetical protein